MAVAPATPPHTEVWSVIRFHVEPAVCHYLGQIAWNRSLPTKMGGYDLKQLLGLALVQPIKNVPFCRKKGTVNPTRKTLETTGGPQL